MSTPYRKNPGRDLRPPAPYSGERWKHGHSVGVIPFCHTPDQGQINQASELDARKVESGNSEKITGLLKTPGQGTGKSGPTQTGRQVKHGGIKMATPFHQTPGKGISQAPIRPKTPGPLTMIEAATAPSVLSTPAVRFSRRPISSTPWHDSTLTGLKAPAVKPTKIESVLVPKLETAEAFYTKTDHRPTLLASATVATERSWRAPKKVASRIPRPVAKGKKVETQRGGQLQHAGLVSGG